MSALTIRNVLSNGYTELYTVYSEALSNGYTELYTVYSEALYNILYYIICMSTLFLHKSYLGLRV